MDKLAASLRERQVERAFRQMPAVDIAALLRERGYKVTPQRLAIYETLSATDTHPSVEMLFQRLLSQHPAMSLATVYKTVNILKSMGVVTSFNVGEDRNRYEIISYDHPHLICTKCRRVENADWPDCGDFADSLQKLKSFTLHMQRYYFYGICAVCMQNSCGEEK
jgi:Fur family peroxide stress response transcriptional regulator